MIAIKFNPKESIMGKRRTEISSKKTAKSNRSAGEGPHQSAVLCFNLLADVEAAFLKQFAKV